MNKQAFYRGFLKAAVDARLVPSPSLTDLQNELARINTSIQQVGPSIGGQLGSTLLDRMNTAISSGAGGLMGAGVGGSLGYWLGKDEEEKKDNRGMTALLGALAGGGAGLAGGALMAPRLTAGGMTKGSAWQMEKAARTNIKAPHSMNYALEYWNPEEQNSYNDWQNHPIAPLAFPKNVRNGIFTIGGHGGGDTQHYSIGDKNGTNARLLRDILESSKLRPDLLEITGCNGDKADVGCIISESPFKNVPRRTYGTPGHVSTTDVAAAAKAFAIAQPRPWLFPTKENFTTTNDSALLQNPKTPSHTAEIRPVIPTSVSIPVGIGLGLAGTAAGLYYWNKKKKKRLLDEANSLQNAPTAMTSRE